MYSSILILHNSFCFPQGYNYRFANCQSITLPLASILRKMTSERNNSVITAFFDDISYVSRYGSVYSDIGRKIKTNLSSNFMTICYMGCHFEKMDVSEVMNLTGEV